MKIPPTMITPNADFTRILQKVMTPRYHEFIPYIMNAVARHYLTLSFKSLKLNFYRNKMNMIRAIEYHKFCVYRTFTALLKQRT
jgi:hypothetical protein